jgi:hypothetical protein
MSYKISSFKAYFNVVVAKMPDIRSAKARPGREERLENAALRKLKSLTRKLSRRKCLESC